MLKIIKNNPPDNVILSNDLLYETSTVDIVSRTESLRKMIEKVEGVTFISETRVISKFNGQPINLNEISTGCKTLINILVNPELPIYVGESGENILREIYRLDEGTLYSPEFLIVDDEVLKGKEFELIDNSVHTIMLYREVWGYYYDR